jgi:hypothetical protein
MPSSDAVKHGGQRQQTPALIVVLGSPGQKPKIGRSIIGAQPKG